MRCKICGAILAPDHDVEICECCRDEYGDNLPDMLRGGDTS